MKFKKLLVRLKLAGLRRIFKRQIEPTTVIEIEYILRTEDLKTREVRYQRYKSMDEIVKYVYFDIPLSVPNYTSKNYTLVHKNVHTGKEHIINLKTGKRTDCEYDNWYPMETI